MNVNFFPLMGFLFLFLGCSQQVSTPPIAIPNAPKVSESARPSLLKTQTNIDSSIEENVRLEQLLEENRKIILAQRLEIIEALRQAEAIQSKDTEEIIVTELEALKLLDQFIKLEKSNASLQEKNAEMIRIIDLQRNLLNGARQYGKETMDRLTFAEIELSELRNQREYLAKSLGNKNNEVVKLQKEKESLIKKLAAATVYKKWFWWTVIGIVLWFIIRLVITSLYPNIRLRV